LIDQTLLITDLFQKHSASVGIIGLGYVGLPMAHLAASRGFCVVGFDIDPNKIEKIQKGESYIQDISSKELSVEVHADRLRASSDFSLLREINVVIITVPTPLNKTGDPDMSFILNSVDSLRPHLHSGMLIVLESTTYPGTTKELFEPLLLGAGLELGREVFVAFSPERIDPGNKVFGPKNTPKVVGGITKNCTEVACAFYRQLVDEVVPVTSSTEAEMVKLYENSFRAINIGLVNELAIICHLLKVDVWEIVKAASTKPFGFMPFYPGPGLGGHCIPVDPNYLSWKMRTMKYKTRFIEFATEINTHMPEWVVTRAIDLLNQYEKPLKGSKILLLGIAYKGDIDDLRESPALDVYSHLLRHGAKVLYHDPYCPKALIEQQVITSKPLTPELLKQQDLVIILTGHHKIDYRMVLEHASLVFDTRNITRNIVDAPKARVEFL
jgi:UDP-N-acetyl-D-glucosamine dehydrogenase